MAKRNNEFQSISALMKKVIEENKLEKGMQVIAVNEAWEKLMGKGIVSYTQKVELQKNTLIVKLNSSVLREELSYGKEKIIKMMNEVLGEGSVKKVLFC